MSETPLTPLPSDEEMEISRKRLGIPEDWEWYPCYTGCGEMVWVPPGFADAGHLQIACTAECVIRFLQQS